LSDVPFQAVWQGDGFTPATPYFQRMADKQFVIGEKYLLNVQQERSVRAHQHYFANLKEAFDNLPERYQADFPDIAIFRAHGLIVTGWRDVVVSVFATADDAKKMAALVQGYDRLAVVVVNEHVVTVMRAKSQSLRAMGKKDFAKSKADVLAWAWGLVGVDPEVGAANAGRAA
jgi:RNase H-fold protein (predicted Holliday junction resolvase)